MDRLTAMRLLLIEDDVEAARYLAKGLQESGYAVDVASDGRDGLFQASEGGYDLIIADRMLPNIDGLTIVQMLRKQGSKIPVLILSALGSVDDRIDGLRAGGDDYLTKPFAFGELMARIEALLRRGMGGAVVTKLKVADLELDLLGRTVTRGGKRIELTAKEFQLLEYLMRRQGQVGHAHHAARRRVGPALRSADQCDRRAHEPAARRRRSRFSAGADPHRARCGLCAAG